VDDRIKPLMNLLGHAVTLRPQSPLEARLRCLLVEAEAAEKAWRSRMRFADRKAAASKLLKAIASLRRKLTDSDLRVWAWITEEVRVHDHLPLASSQDLQRHREARLKEGFAGLEPLIQALQALTVMPEHAEKGGRGVRVLDSVQPLPLHQLIARSWVLFQQIGLDASTLITTKDRERSTRKNLLVKFLMLTLEALGWTKDEEDLRKEVHRVKKLFEGMQTLAQDPEGVTQAEEEMDLQEEEDAREYEARIAKDEAFQTLRARLTRHLRSVQGSVALIGLLPEGPAWLERLQPFFDHAVDREVTLFFRGPKGRLDPHEIRPPGPGKTLSNL
jgi:hypothetical protein